MSDDSSAWLERIETLLKAILMVQIHRLQAEDDSSRADPRSLEALLFEAGLASPTEIGLFVNKTRQAVSQRLKTEGVL